MENSSCWNEVPANMKCYRQDVIRQVLTSRAKSTAKRYLSEINKFFCWSRQNGIPLVLPYDSVIAAIYLSDVMKRSKSGTSVVLAFSALKWLHGFIPANNPLDNYLCRNIMESAKRTRCITTPKEDTFNN